MRRLTPGRYKKLIGYVPQEDLLLPELTVRETMMHSALIRLPRSWTDLECERHVDLLLRCLHLQHVQHNIIGDPSNRCLSGGERKRLSIGIELAAAPMALFLDEPTSGLDAASALSIVRLLRQLSRMGVTITLIIHQPRREIFNCLDDIILLEKGRQIYQGPRADLRSHFESLGHSFSNVSNPADLIIDVISTGKAYSKEATVPQSAKIEKRHEGNIETRDRTIQDESNLKDLLTLASHRGAPWLHQLWLCFIRSLKQQQRRVSSFYLEISVGGIAGLIIGLSLYSFQGLHFQGIYLPPFERLSSSVNNNTVGMIALMVCMAIGLTASPPGVRIFGDESK